MKKNNLILSLIVIFFTVNSFATTRMITVQNFSFSPSSLTANVGDTIKWQWVSGTHTTTSTTIPIVATSWDAPISSSSPTFIYVLSTPGTYNYKCTPHESMGMTGVITAQPNAIKQIESVVNNYKLEQNYPNPFNPVTKINFNILKQGNVNLNIYDASGRFVKSLVNETLSQGSYAVDFDASGISSGVYFYRLETKEFTDVKRMILVK